MGREASTHLAVLLVPVTVTDTVVMALVRVDVDTPVAVVPDDSVDVTVDDIGDEVVVDDMSAAVVVGDGTTVVQLEPTHLETLMSAQFQNFSAPLLLVLGSTTAEGHEGSNGFHQAVASPPNLDVIHDCVELWLK